MVDSFDMMAAEMTADVIRDLGASAVFKPQLGPEVDTYALIDTDIELQGEDLRVAEDTDVLSAIRADVGVPSVGDVFTVDGTDYTVDGFPDDEPGDQYLVRVLVR